MRAIRSISAAMAFVVVAAAGFATAQSTRSAVDIAQARHDEFRRLGAAFKGVNDGLRQREPDAVAIRAHAQTIARLSQALPGWFPAGSGPSAGVETRAKAEIWSDAGAFAARTRAFQQAASDLSAATELTDLRARARALGGECARCHSAFREPE